MRHQLARDLEPVVSPSELGFQSLTDLVWDEVEQLGECSWRLSPSPHPMQLEENEGLCKQPAHGCVLGAVPGTSRPVCPLLGLPCLFPGACQGHPHLLVSLAVCFPPCSFSASLLSQCICSSLHLWLCLSLPPPPTFLILHHSTPADSSTCHPPFPDKPILCP